MSPEVAYAIAAAGKLDNWVAACGGTEQPFVSRGGHRLLYCYNPGQGRHAYINLDTDMALSDDDARASLGLW